MVRIGAVLSFKRASTEGGIPISDVQVDFGSGYIVTARHYAPPGLDLFPLKGDRAVCSQAGSEWIAHAFFDPQQQPLAEEGECVFTSRSAPGEVKAKVHLKVDGSIVLNDKVTITPEGNILTEGTIEAQGDISSDGEVTAMATGPGVTLSQHLHNSGTGPTAPPTSGT